MPAKPELLILGDSHSIALKAGADMLGIRAEALHFSGSRWHEVKFTYGANGFEPRGTKAGVNQMRALRERLGVEDVFGMGVPVISTMAFHLGRLVPPFGWEGHQIQDEDAPFIDTGLVASRAFALDYVQHYRLRHLRVAKRLARSTDLTIVAPPPAFDRPNYDSMRAIISGLLTQAGVTVYDPREDLADTDGMFTPDMLEADGVHATAETGAKIIEAMRKRGLLRL